MNVRISITDISSIENAIKQLEAYQKKMDEKADEIVRRLAEIGKTSADAGFRNALYDGNKEFSVDYDKTQGGYVVTASGKSVLFVEFGAGVRYGNGHPENGKFGMGPGTWPNPKVHKYRGVLYPNWQNPNGWYLPKEAGGGHTFGNAPAMPMYNAEQEIKANIEKIVREVLGSD